MNPDTQAIYDTLFASQSILFIARREQKDIENFKNTLLNENKSIEQKNDKKEFEERRKNALDFEKRIIETVTNLITQIGLPVEAFHLETLTSKGLSIFSDPAKLLKALQEANLVKTQTR
jgi:hypothetical protein